jgi:hypothetical protein
VSKGQEESNEGPEPEVVAQESVAEAAAEVMAVEAAPEAMVVE